MPRGSSPKREREYDELKHRFRKSGRYKGREQEVAARIVNKQRARFGETKKAKRQEREGRSPDRDLPIEGYRHLTISELTPKLDDLSSGELRRIRDYEKEHKNRKTLMSEINQKLKAA